MRNIGAASEGPTPPLLSIVMATWNAESVVTHTLDSLAGQESESLARVQILVIDGGSTDRTLDLVGASGLSADITSESDNGIYDAMNKGAARARGTWLHFLNAGDRFSSSHALSHLLDHLDRAPNDVVWAVGGARNLGGGSGPSTPIPSIPHNWFRHAYGLQPHCHQATWFRRSLFDLGIEHDLTLPTAADFDLILRIGLLSHPLEIPEHLVDYLGGGVSEGQWKSSAMQMHASRAKRLDLPRPARYMDRVTGTAIRDYARLRVSLGRLLRRASHN